ncbi:hypothetical protein FGO68_gene9379 [Halteria grandinella]|uniref:B box-type domain-containing protein n=1 Tax=Halteria grandinella TaxID=5974 RepID=A0A8J8SYB2_HALGN|nr:hypothetical protein FGO68_gene9379 [Halteria grandinella]
MEPLHNTSNKIPDSLPSHKDGAGDGESISTATKKDRSNAPKCLVHKREKVQLHCTTEDMGICIKCVASHKGHEMFEIKDRCANLMKPWTDLKAHVTKLRNKMEAVIGKIPEKEMGQLDSNIAKLNNKFQELLEFKKNCNFKSLQNNLDSYFGRFQDKTLNLAKKLSKQAFEDLEEKKSLLSKGNGPDEEVKEGEGEGKPSEKLISKFKEMRKTIKTLNHSNESLTTKVQSLEDRLGNVEVLNSQLAQKHEHLKAEYEKLMDIIKGIDLTQKTHSQPSVVIIEKKRDVKGHDKKDKKKKKAKEFIHGDEQIKAAKQRAKSEQQSEEEGSKLHLKSSAELDIESSLSD